MCKPVLRVFPKSLCYVLFNERVVISSLFAPARLSLKKSHPGIESQSSHLNSKYRLKYTVFMWQMINASSINNVLCYLEELT